MVFENPSCVRLVAISAMVSGMLCGSALEIIETVESAALNRLRKGKNIRKLQTTKSKDGDSSG